MNSVNNTVMAATDETENSSLRKTQEQINAENQMWQDDGKQPYRKGSEIEPAPEEGGVIDNPEARAKARAKQAYFSDAGRVITPGATNNNRFQGRYQMGRVKGLTADQANEKFEGLWAKSGPQLREKYAKMADPAAGLAPSEKAAQLKAQEEKRARENPVPIPQADAKPAPGADFEKLTEARPQKFNMDASGLAAGPDGKINAIGDGSTKDGVYNPASDIDSRMANSPVARGLKAIGGLLANAGPMSPNMQSPSAAMRPEMAGPPASAKPVSATPAFVGPPASAIPSPIPSPAPAPVVAAAPPFVGPPSSANPRSAIGQIADAAKLTRSSPLADRMATFAPKQGEELIGMKRGVPQYAPKSAPVTATPGMLAQADAALREQGIQKTTAPRALPMRGPASQPAADPMSYKRPEIQKPNMDVMKQHADAMTRQHAYGADPALAKETQGIFNSADVNTRNAIGGQVALRAKGIDKAIEKPKPQAVSSRVTASRPATPEELRTRRVM